MLLAFLNLLQAPSSLTGQSASQSAKKRDRPQQIPSLPMEIDIARVDSLISPNASGRVTFEAVSYPAQCLQNVTYHPGTLVKVMFRQGNTLIVDTWPDGPVSKGSKYLNQR